ncbi:MAG: hypothetical protein SGCHY_002097 [Lobulomycetales sp.]
MKLADVTPNTVAIPRIQLCVIAAIASTANANAFIVGDESGSRGNGDGGSRVNANGDVGGSSNDNDTRPRPRQYLVADESACAILSLLPASSKNVEQLQPGKTFAFSRVYTVVSLSSGFLSLVCHDNLEEEPRGISVDDCNTDRNMSLIEYQYHF